MAKRVILLTVVNILIIASISIVVALLGLNTRYMPADSQAGLMNLLVVCGVFGFGGAFISLALSRIMAKWMMRVKVIDPQSPEMGAERDLLQMVHRMAQSAGLPKMPEVGIYQSPEVNAFATGPTKSRALVAVSTGLLQKMDTKAVEGVIGHEIAHVANGDMVTMTLVQGVVNTFVMFFARILAFFISSAIAKDKRGSSFVEFGLIMVFQIVFGLLGSIVVNYYSRLREFKADKGGARYAGRDKMIHALESLNNSADLVDTSQASLATLKINGKFTGLLSSLLSTHPRLEDRIHALKTEPM